MQDIELQEVDSIEGSGDALVSRDYALLNNVKVDLTVQVGTANMTVDELFSMKKGQVLKLNESIEKPIDLLLGDKLIAKGKLTVCDDNFAIEIMQVSS